MKKRVPTFHSDDEAEAFVANEDLSNYDLSGGELVQFEFKPKSKSINIRLSEELLSAVQQRASIEGIPYQRFIRQAIEHAVVKR